MGIGLMWGWLAVLILAPSRPALPGLIRSILACAFSTALVGGATLYFAGLQGMMGYAVCALLGAGLHLAWRGAVGSRHAGS